MITEQKAVSACVASLVGNQPYVFLIDGGTAGIAVAGVPMTYRTWTIAAIEALYGINATSITDAAISETLDRENLDLHRHVKLPDAFCKQAPTMACRNAVKAMFREIKKEEDAADRIIDMLRRVEEDYATVLADYHRESAARLDRIARKIRCPDA